MFTECLTVLEHDTLWQVAGTTVQVVGAWCYDIVVSSTILRPHSASFRLSGWLSRQLGLQCTMILSTLHRMFAFVHEVHEHLPDVTTTGTAYLSARGHPTMMHEKVHSITMRSLL